MSAFVNAVRERALGNLDEAILRLGLRHRLAVFECLDRRERVVAILDDGANPRPS